MLRQTVVDQLPFEAELIARIGWLIRLRWLAILGTAVAIGLAAVLFRGQVAVGALLGVTAAIAVYNLQFAFYLRTLRIGRSGTDRLRHATLFSYVQIALDLLALAALLHFAGGIENPLVFFFVFHVILASILLTRAVSYVMAALATLLVAALASLEYWRILPHHPLPFVSGGLYREPAYLLVSVGVLASTLFLTVYLTTSITARLRDRDRELVESHSTCQVRSQELAELNEQLRRMDAERTRFLVLVTHELRSPISTIYSALELVRSGYANAAERDEVLERAQKRARELLQLISELLDLTRIREQSVRREGAQPVQLADVLREVADFMKVEAESQGISLELEVAQALAPVRSQPDQIKLVWTNLVSNAIKYNRPGGSVRVSLSQDEQHVVAHVRDTGIGIPPDDLPRVFEEFYRAGNARLVSPHGTGVGLAIVRRVVENWGGRVWAESEPGHGTEISFFLPRADR